MNRSCSSHIATFNMDSLKRYDLLHKPLSLAGKLFGVDLLNPDWHWGIGVKCDLVLCVLAVASYFHYLQKFWEDFDFVCYSTIIITPTIAGMYRLIYWPIRKDLVRTLYEECLEFCVRFMEDPKLRKIVEKYAILYNFVITAMVVLLVAAFIFIGTSPIFIYLLTGEKMLPLPVYLIGLDFESHPGYELNYLMVLCDCYVGAIGFSYIQSLTLLYIAISISLVEILRSKVIDLENAVLLVQDNDESTIVKQFKEIIELHVEIIKFSLKVEDLLNFQYFLDVTILTLTVVFALFYAHLANWIPGYIGAVVVLIAALFNYGFGEISIMKLSKLNQSTYNVSWYRMSIKMRKMYIILLQKTQVTHFFTVAGLRPINIDLYASVRE